jgi:hypothetical protein
VSRRTAFVVGCQRSGTTLFRFLLGARQDVRSIDEEAAYPILTGQQPRPDDDDRLVVYKIPRFAEQLLLPDVCDELFGTHPTFYRGEPGVFVVRDPRDVVASMCTLRANDDTSWIEAYGRVMIEHRMAARPEQMQAHADRVDELQRRNWPAHLTAALYWSIRNAALPDYVAAGLPLLPIGYDALVREPDPELQRICAQLEVPFDPRMLHHQEQQHDQLDAAGFAIGNSDPKRAIDATSVGRYRQALTPAQIDEVEQRTGELFTALQRCLAGEPPR